MWLHAQFYYIELNGKGSSNTLNIQYVYHSTGYMIIVDAIASETNASLCGKMYLLLLLSSVLKYITKIRSFKLYITTQYIIISLLCI